LPIFHDGTALSCPIPTAGPNAGQRHCHSDKCTDYCTRIHFKAIPDSIPRFKDILNRDQYLPHVPQLLESDRFKPDYADAFDRQFRQHVDENIRRHQEDIVGVNIISTIDETIVGVLRTPRNANREKQFDEAKFVHLFMAPLFRMVASNWARLVVRRSFDLDLLEWRPKDRVTSDTINEAKSRRISIARHRRDINSSVEILKSLMLEEQNQKLSREELERHNAEKATQVLALSETESGWNRGRSNGLVSESAKPDSWERIYWDFFELKTQMDALEDRANKIQEGIVGLISVTHSENAGLLSAIAFFFSISILPFSVIGSIYGANINPGGPSKRLSVFVTAVVSTFFAALAILLLSLSILRGLPFSIPEFRGDFKLRLWLRSWRNPRFTPPTPTTPKQRSSGPNNV
jgi:Mg2+ and Co2+ transporter CorA